MGGFDLVVIGSGVAGLITALTAAPRARVALFTKGQLHDGCSRWAQGGIAAAIGTEDSAQQHFDDTIAAGRGLCHPDAVRVLVEEGPARVRQLIDWGVTFDTQDGQLLLGREAAHSRARIVHAHGDGTGLEIESALIRRIRQSAVTVVEHAHVARLLVNRDGRCVGIEWLDGETERRHRVSSNAVVLASGGAGRLWPSTTNPASATGDGVALAYAAGADIAGMEFVQFHPTALALEDAPSFLISEAVRGEGAVVVNEDGRRFLFDADPRAELAGRDVVSRAIWHELQRTGAPHAYLDCTRVPALSLRFPGVYATCLRYGLDIDRHRIPIAPAAHYMIGGVRTDLRGATTVAGLYACGEVASTGVHGANRLASNSLLESVVFAHRAAGAALSDIAEMPPQTLPEDVPSAPVDGDTVADQRDWETLRTALWHGAGIVRDAAGLREALDVCDRVARRSDGGLSLSSRKLHAAATTATLVCRSALARAESRGCHIRSDHPDSSDEWRGDFVMHKQRGAHLDDHI